MHECRHSCLVPPLPPLSVLSHCAVLFYIDVRHVGRPHPSCDGAQWPLGRGRALVEIDWWAGLGTGPYQWCRVSEVRAAASAVAPLKIYWAQ